MHSPTGHDEASGAMNALPADPDAEEAGARIARRTPTRTP
jgi:hypothetical protein